MRAPEEVVGLLVVRQGARSGWRRIAQQVRAAAEGKFAVPLPEVDAIEAPATANLIVQGIDQTGMRIASTSPNVKFFATKPGQKMAERLARDRGAAFAGLYADNAIRLLDRRRARWFVAYGSAPAVVRPADGRVMWEARDPLVTFPAPSADPDAMMSDDCVFSIQRPWWWVMRNFPAEAARLRRPKSMAGNEIVTLVEYVDDETWMLVAASPAESSQQAISRVHGDSYATTPGIGVSGPRQSRPDTMVGTEAAVLLAASPNRAGVCPVVNPQRICLGEVTGQFDQMIGVYAQQAKLMALEINAVTESVYPPLWAIQNANEQLEIVTVADGKRGIVGELRGGTLQPIQLTPGFQTYPTIDRLERTQRLNGGIPSDFGGECVDSDTDILTADGWKRHDEVGVGTSVLTLNHDTGMSEWNEIERMNIFPAQRREMMLIEGQRFSSLTTLNHRWPVVMSWSGKRDWRTSDSLSQSSRIPTAAVCADLPSEPKWSDALVDVVAWFWTEGTVANSGVNSSTGGSIAQSVIENPHKVAMIENALSALWGPPTTSFRKASGASRGNLGHDGIPRWDRPEPNAVGVINFRLSAHAVRQLLAIAPSKVVRKDWLRELTLAQLERFIHVSMLGDNAGPNRLGQSDERRSDAFAFAALLAGYGVSYRRRDRVETRPQFKSKTSTTHMVRLKTTRLVNPVENARRMPHSARYERVVHDGMVWCPTTANHTWLARRNGTVYFTGNSSNGIRTGRQGELLLASTIDFPIQEAQETFARSRWHENLCAVAVGRGHYRSKQFSFAAAWRARGRDTFTFGELFPDEASVAHQVSFAMPGSDASGALIRVGQKMGLGLISKQTAREQDGEIPDPELEKDRIDAEALEDALRTAMQQQAASGAIPPADVARITQLVRTDRMDLADAITQVHEEAQQRQAAQAPAGAPETQPGLAQPGAGAEQPAAVGPPADLAGLTALSGALRLGQRAAPQEQQAGLAAASAGAR